MDSSNFVKNLTSKDINLAQDTLKELIRGGSLENFKKLVNNSDYIFPFLKERICQDFVKLLNKEDLKTVFEFSKIYSEDFAPLIVKSWTKFASEDLTDEILELFENGTIEQKAYCALYFNYIKDPLAIECLNKFAFSDFEPLKINCSKVLSAFKDETKLKEAIELLFETEDEFEKLNLYEFICAYKSDKALNFVLENCFECSFSDNIILNLLDTYDFSYLQNHIKPELIYRIFQVLLENYPENISLSTILYYQVFDYIKFISKNNSNYAKNLILKAKKDFEEYLSNDIYNYDLDKSAKQELKEIVDYLKNIDTKTDLTQELKAKEIERFNLALFILKEYNLKEYLTELIDLVNTNQLKENFLIEAINTIKVFNHLDLIDKSIVEKIENENIKAVIISSLA